jgi:hypothetical protein
VAGRIIFTTFASASRFAKSFGRAVVKPGVRGSKVVEPAGEYISKYRQVAECPLRKLLVNPEEALVFS